MILCRKDADNIKEDVSLDREKYSRGRRGAPAKGVGRGNRRESSNLSFSEKQKSAKADFLFFGEKELPLAPKAREGALRTPPVAGGASKSE